MFRVKYTGRSNVTYLGLKKLYIYYLLQSSKPSRQSAR